MQLPQLALPDQGLWCPNGDGCAGDEYEANDGDDDDGGEDPDNDEEPDGNCLLDGVGEATELSVAANAAARFAVSTYAMLRSSSENGRLFGVMSPRT